jgi:hypothetical protein
MYIENRHGVEICRHEFRAPTLVSKCLDGLGATRRIAAVDDNLGAVASELGGNDSAEARRCTAD